MIDIIVDFPAPFSPNSTCTSPGSKVKFHSVERKDARISLADLHQFQERRIAGGAG